MLQSIIAAKISGHVENHVHMHFDYFFPVLHIAQFTRQNFHTHHLEDIFTFFTYS